MHVVTYPDLLVIDLTTVADPPGQSLLSIHDSVDTNLIPTATLTIMAL